MDIPRATLFGNSIHLQDGVRHLVHRKDRHLMFISINENQVYALINFRIPEEI